MNVNAIDAVRTEEVNVNLTERGFLAYKRKVSNTFNPPRAPNAFELATAKALWRATMQALNGSVKGKHISVSAATGSGKLRIPVHAGPRFRRMPGHHSSPCRAMIAAHAGPLFRLMPAGCDAG